MVFLFLKKKLSDTDHGKYRFRARKTLFLVILTVVFPKRDYFHFLEKCYVKGLIFIAYAYSNMVSFIKFLKLANSTYFTGCKVTCMYVCMCFYIIAVKMKVSVSSNVKLTCPTLVAWLLLCCQSCT